MKILFTVSIFLLLGISKLSAATVNPDSLKQQLTVTSDSLKAPLYTQIAATYLSYDTVNNKYKKLIYQNNAISYTLQAIHYYSRYNDTTGLRVSFDNLARVYRSQSKFSQAKWFILQSNTLSRAKNDVPNVISSLMELALIKTDIKDYKLAMRDLNEALQLSSANHLPKTESDVEMGYVTLYNNMKNYTKADIALKRYDFINDSIRRGEEAKITNAADSVQRKKKVYLTSNKRFYKANSGKRIALL
jgi:tetratricopeptide (TPR) repeat protein